MESLALMLASMNVDLSKFRYNVNSGSSLNEFSLAPTLENPSIFKGRYQLHGPECHPVEPYRAVKESCSLDSRVQFTTAHMQQKAISMLITFSKSLSEIVRVS
jgi:hypothetical protein